MQVQNRLFDIICRAAVVIDHGDAGDRFEQRLAFDLLRSVGIDDDQKTAVIRFDQRVLPGDEQVLIPLRGVQF